MRASIFNPRITTTSTTLTPVDTTKMASRPTVSIATAEGKPSGATATLPAVFNAPIRPDIVQYVGGFDEDEDERN